MSNDKGKKNWPSRTFRLPPELLDRLEVYTKQTGISKTFVFRKALEEYLNNHQ